MFIIDCTFLEEAKIATLVSALSVVTTYFSTKIQLKLGFHTLRSSNTPFYSHNFPQKILTYLTAGEKSWCLVFFLAETGLEKEILFAKSLIILQKTHSQQTWPPFWRLLQNRDVTHARVWLVKKGFCREIQIARVKHQFEKSFVYILRCDSLQRIRPHFAPFR